MIRKKNSIIAILIILAAILLASCSQSPDPTRRRPKSPEATTSEELDIGEDAVVSIVLARVPEASREDIVSLECEYEDGIIIYEGTVLVGRIEYEFTIDGRDGTILEWEIDD